MPIISVVLRLRGFCHNFYYIIFLYTYSRKMRFRPWMCMRVRACVPRTKQKITMTPEWCQNDERMTNACINSYILKLVSSSLSNEILRFEFKPKFLSWMKRGISISRSRHNWETPMKLWIQIWVSFLRQISSNTCRLERLTIFLRLLPRHHCDPLVCLGSLESKPRWPPLNLTPASMSHCLEKAFSRFP